MDEEKAKHAYFEQGFFHRMLGVVKGTANLQSLTSAVDWSRWVGIRRFPAICSPNFCFMGGVRK